jgi:hypothetical protein
MSKFLHLQFWFAKRRNEAWKQMELFACDRKMKAALEMHNLWKRITGEELKK